MNTLLEDPLETTMDKNFLAGLLGPFAMETPPVREGLYAVALKGTPLFEMWFWDGSAWLDSDDGLGETRPSESASGWYGKFQSGTETHDGLDDGLGE
jgi:hypothetical protein